MTFQTVVVSILRCISNDAFFSGSIPMLIVDATRVSEMYVRRYNEKRVAGRRRGSLLIGMQSS